MTAEINTESEINVRVAAVEREWEESEWFQRWLELNRQRMASGAN